MQGDPSSRLPAHRLKHVAIVSRKTAVMDDFELERLSIVMDQTRANYGGCRSQIVRVERKSYDDAIAHGPGGRHLIRPFEPAWRSSNYWSPSKRLYPVGH